MTTKIDKALQKYIALRDGRDELKKKHQEEMRERFLDPMDAIELAFLKHFNKTGQSGAKSKGIGTVFVSERTSDKVVDREAFLEYVLKNKATAFLTSKVSKAALDEHIEQTGDLIPGVTRRIDRTINIRRG